MESKEVRTSNLFSHLSVLATFGFGFVLFYAATSPGAGKNLVMRVAKYSEVFSMRRAQVWAHRASKCETLYKQTSGALV